MSDPLTPTREQAVQRIWRQSIKLEAALAKAREERDRLDRLLAEAVSSDPASVTWYLRPGIVPLEEALGQITGGPAALHQAVERYRKTLKPKAKAKPKRAGRRNGGTR